MRHRLTSSPVQRCSYYQSFLQLRFYKPRSRPAPSQPTSSPDPPKPPKPPKKPLSFNLHEIAWEDEYNWMSHLKDKVAMRHMSVYMDSEDKYTQAVMLDTENRQAKFFSEMTIRYHYALCTPPLHWGPWLYYRRIEEGKQYPILCRRLASLHEKFLSNSTPSTGFDYVTGKKIEQKLIDYNQEAERFGGYAYEELSEVSPDHKYIAYTMYDKDNDCFRLSVRNLNSGALCSKPQAYRVSGLAWANGGQTLVYAVTDQHKRACRIFCSIIGSVDEDVLLMNELDEKVQLSIRNTKDFRYITINASSPQSSKVFLLNAADPTSGATLLWECDSLSHFVVEHHRGVFYLFTDAPRNDQPVDHHYLLYRMADDLSSRDWKPVFTDSQDLIIEDLDFCDKYVVLTVKEGLKPKLCSVPLPLPLEKATWNLKKLYPKFLPLPENVSKIGPGTNYDFYSSVMRYTISSPVMPDAVVDYDLSNDSWKVVLQKDVIHARTKVLYGMPTAGSSKTGILTNPTLTPGEAEAGNENPWNELTEFYACEHHEVISHDGVAVPLTAVYSRNIKPERGKPCLLHGHGAYGEPLDKRWRSEHKSLLDRGWVIAFADVRGGGGLGRRWHHDGRGAKKLNSVKDYIACGKYLVDKGIADEGKLCGWGYSAGGLLVAAAMNNSPELLRAAILNVPFLDVANTLMNPVIPLTSSDYDEFGHPGVKDEFLSIMAYSPYENIPQDVLYPAVMITSSFDSRFGTWEAAKYAARVRERTISDPRRPVVINWTRDAVDNSKYLECRNAAVEAAFLVKMTDL